MSEGTVTQENMSAFREGEPGKLSEATKRAIEELIRQRDGTDPAQGALSEALKDVRAMQALILAGRVMQDLVGWAIDHHIGLAAAGLRPVGYMVEKKLSPDYQRARAAVDNHAHEIAGIEVRDGKRGLTAAERRRFFAQILFLYNAGMPEDFTDDLSDALEALELSEVFPLLEPRRDGKKVNYTEYKEQLNAIASVKFRQASGLLKVGEAQDEIAKVYGISADTLRTWEKRLRKHLGKLEFEIRVRRAVSEGRSVSVMKQKNRSRAYSLLVGNERFGDAAVKEAAKRYHASLRGQKDDDLSPRLDSGSETSLLRTQKARRIIKISDTKNR